METLFPSATAELLDTAKERLGLTTDYKLAQALKWTHQKVSGLRTGQNCMSLLAAAEFARATGIPLEEVAHAAEIDKQPKREIRRTA